MSHFTQRWALLKERSFLCFFLSMFMIALGSGISYIATSWLVVQNAHLDNTDAILPVTILMLCFWLPGTLLGPVMGVLADRYPRRIIILITNVLRSVIWIIFGFCFFNSITNNWLYLLGILSGTLLSLYIPTAMAFIREIVTAEELLYANSAIDIAYEIGNVVGMGLAGFVMVFVPAERTILINGICFLIATLSTLMIPHYQSNIIIKGFSIKNLLKELKDGLQYLTSSKKLLIIYSLQLIVFVQLMTTPVLIVPFAKSVLHATVAQFGQIEAALSVGIVLGSVIISWVVEKLGFTKVTFFLCTLSLPCFLLFAYNQNISLAILLYFLLGFYFATWSLIITEAQAITALEYQGRVQSTFSGLSGLVILLMYIIVNIGGMFFDLKNLYFFEVALSIFAMWLVKES